MHFLLQWVGEGEGKRVKERRVKGGEGERDQENRWHDITATGNTVIEVKFTGDTHAKLYCTEMYFLFIYML